ncbi:DNA sulfur modification protein DndB [Streptomyces sp. XD-27]|uniref:DNA sulfur modification protein DndB n=1 Tax=Streptomyces sp. XD-27 TaxID=3062779 RepID=UPI0026F44AAC|nr:DNA sulfur modification protein DndB [Streptomyces sp. XD-27]WKX72373.1 DNA sulfur modification protein DndB [Streptomyces sp. XD-27]
MHDPHGPEYVDQLDPSRGHALRVTPVAPMRYIAAMRWDQLHSLVPDPRQAEAVKELRYLSEEQRTQAELRNEIQRTIKGTKKKDNARACAGYIAASLKGERGECWATPPFALWLPGEMDVVRARSPFGDVLLAYVPYGTTGILVDAETQHLAHLLLLEDPAAYGLAKAQVNHRVVSVEIYNGIDVVAARQIFHDRNLLGVVPNKNVALRNDSSSIATNIAQWLLDDVVIPRSVHGEDVPLRRLVSETKRQLGDSDTEWMTLSSLRAFVVTALFGRAGIAKTSGPVNEPPDGCTEKAARLAVAEVSTALFGAFAGQFDMRTSTVIAAPAMLAALGVVAHRSMPWAAEPRRSASEIISLLSDVCWARVPAVWDGIVGKRTFVPPAGKSMLSLAGGIKDNASKTATALEDPTSPRYRQVRMQIGTAAPAHATAAAPPG